MADNIISLKAAKAQSEASHKKTRCPQCGGAAVKPHTPFCSRRCSQIDLGKWLNEDYRVPQEAAIDETDVDALIAELEKDHES